jgi:predicted membrane protein
MLLWAKGNKFRVQNMPAVVAQQCTIEDLVKIGIDAQEEQQRLKVIIRSSHACCLILSSIKILYFHLLIDVSMQGHKSSKLIILLFACRTLVHDTRTTSHHEVISNYTFTDVKECINLVVATPFVLPSLVHSLVIYPSASHSPLCFHPVPFPSALDIPS